MKYFCLVLLSLFLGTQNYQAQTVNAIIGDSSWYYSSGSWPDAHTVEKKRIQSHLAFVITRLKARSVATELQLARLRTLSLLESYLEKGEFPSNFKYPSAERRPCFIDDDGKLCAVGYLMAQTAGLAEAERINSKFRFHYLAYMQDSALSRWQQTSGLSQKELAMIQPAYSPPQKYYRFRNRNGKFGLKRSSTNLYSIYPRYKALYHDENQTFFWARNNKAWKIYDRSTLPINFSRYDTVFLWRQNKELNLLVANKDYTESFDEKGDSRFKLKGVFPFRVAGSIFIAKEASQMGVYNWDGDEIVSPAFDIIYPIYSLGHSSRVLISGPQKLQAFQVLKKGKWGIINTKGESLIKAEWEQIRHERGLYIAESRNLGKRAFLMNGDSLILNGLLSIKPSLCAYCSEINLKEGRGIFNGYLQKWAISPHKAIEHANKVAYRVQAKNGKWGLANKEGRFIFPCQFDSISVFDEYAILRDSAQMLLSTLYGDTIIVGDYWEVGLLVKNEAKKISRLFYALSAKGMKIFDQQGREKFQELGLSGFDLVEKAFVILYQSEKKILGQYYEKELKIFPELEIEAMRYVGSNYYIYRSRGREGIVRQFYGQETDSANFKTVNFDSLIPIAGPGDYSLYLAKKKGLWGVYDASLDSLIIATEQIAYFPKELGNSERWIYFIDAEKVWRGYYYTSPKLNYLMPAAQERLSETYLRGEPRD
jgi:hypothetical protein